MNNVGYIDLPDFPVNKKEPGSRFQAPGSSSEKLENYRGQIRVGGGVHSGQRGTPGKWQVSARRETKYSPWNLDGSLVLVRREQDRGQSPESRQRPDSGVL
ncbi:unnamed protein product [Ambrosiozyma monospora]|uniref:Unnamed protein product n=1 Tax=Ambrosiozyma monospora TaxID=43982 RepID=A0A9W7DP55_AMBMO|nr:unnamed protein product [Ambrosiozyma monospora]